MDGLMGFMTAAAPVRVQRNGNSRVLPIPADIARALQADFGTVFSVEARGDDVVFHRVHAEPSVELRGEGRAQFGVLPEGAAVAAERQRSSVPPLDWDF